MIINKKAFKYLEIAIEQDATLKTWSKEDALEGSNEQAFDFLTKHQKGDFGIVGKEDWKENELSINEGFRILSAYKTKNDIKIWIITEADRSSTTILLPSEY